ncbi:signal transduction histidine kinase [Paenibacillus endophyticus]|uniref:histidine kinase n=1 Tax=Paenibacillus endophyticus TaxID=1294268 RepID=A0A7W5C3T4_9BACL|nr:HAMP domain-containing sensor histidine kinase [Paenibacillus endophyticus]MBB3150352.1 signal transduction histidine kinase [Paenibacillus endophyticus]
MKLGSKIHLYSSVLFTVLLLIANATVYTVFSKMMLERELDKLAAETKQAAAALRLADQPAATTELLRAYVPLEGMLQWVPEAENGSGILVTSASETDLSNEKAVYSAEQTQKRLKIEGKSYSFVSIPIIGANGDVANVQATESLEELMELLQILRLVLVSVSAAVLVPVLISSGLLGRIVMRPISAMTRTMRQITRSGQFMRLKQEGKSRDELVEMGETFNDMIGLLAESFMRQEQFVSNASHELKTPLTIIESYASLLKRRLRDRPELLEESIEAIHSEAVRMKGLTEQLLLAMPRSEWKIEREPLDLLPFAEQAVAFFRSAYGREIHVVLQGEDSVTVMTDQDKLKQVLFILLDNARKYSNDRIEIELGRADKDSYLRVKDLGIGIPAEELSKVFERFYRVDKSRSRDQEPIGGTGLGLSLGKELADAIGVKLVLESIQGKGTTATIRIP